jgi:monoamine oxidase
MTSDPDIVIVGAGAAGIGAARRLSGRGLSVVLIESLDRLGGRASTSQTTAGPLDLGCGWLHSADRNPWVDIAEASGVEVHRGPTAWNSQFRGLGFPHGEREAARKAFAEWTERVTNSPPTNDRAIDAVPPDEEWTQYLQAMSGFISGDELERISARDYANYDVAATDANWRVPTGYGALIEGSLPTEVKVHLGTSVNQVSIEAGSVALMTSQGTLKPRAIIMTASTNVLSGDSIRWPSQLEPWREAAAKLPLGNNEKLFLEITGNSPFETETHVLGNPHDALTGSYYIRPFGFPVIECFLGGAGARCVASEGLDAAFDRAIAQLVALFGSDVQAALRPIATSNWTNTASIGGAYSHALPGHAKARSQLARPFEKLIFFAGEATEAEDFSTAHGAYQSGLRAANQVLKAFGAVDG